MIEVNSIDAIPGEGEILTLMATYMASRLFTKRQRRSLSVIIDVTRDVVREPVTRRMLGPQKAGLGTRPPKLFEMTVSTAAGLRDAAEVVAHELLHISQAVNGRLQITEKKKKINRKKTLVHVARWMGGKPIVMDDLPWHQRPWEIEACGWQSQLVTEFLMLTTGQPVDQPVQSPKRKQLALYPVSVPAPVSPVLQEPVFTPDMPAAAAAAAATPVTPGQTLETNAASIDRLMDGVAPAAAPSVADDTAQLAPREPAEDIAIEDPAEAAIDVPLVASGESEDELVAGLTADLTAELAADQTAGSAYGRVADENANGVLPADAGVSNGNGNGAGHAAAAVSATPDALLGAPVYSKPVIEVDVPGLDAPRSLQRDAIAKKLGELRKRGLTTAEISGI